jgi:predicted lipoprotein
MRRLLLAAVLTLVATTASAQTDLAAITRGMIEGHIVPAYASLSELARRQVSLSDDLCAAPSTVALQTVQRGFGDLVDAWSQVEFIRFGPAREDNRYERLFFWPDRNGRGLSQVQGVITGADPTVTSVESLQGKSVALQGLLALDYVLFGTGFESLAEGNAHRCAYARAIAGAIAATSSDVLEGWQGVDGFAALMMAPGPDNPIYRSEGEALQELLRAMAEQLQIVHDAKLLAVVGSTPQEARPRRAPFWRSGATLPSIIANARAMLALNDAGGFAERLPMQAQRYAGTVRFELEQVISWLEALDGSGAPLDQIIASEETHDRLASVALPLAGAMRVIGEVYPAELGLTVGFNSLDGD